MSSVLHHLRHPLTWIPPSTKYIQTPLAIQIDSSPYLWAFPILGTVGTTHLLKVKTDYSAKIIAALSLISLTLIFYTCTALIKFAYRHMHHKLKAQTYGEISKKILDYYAHHGLAAPLVYVGSSKQPVKASTFHFADDEVPEEAKLALDNQNSSAWKFGYRVPEPGFIPEDTPGLDPLLEVPHQLVEMQRRFPFELAMFWPPNQKSTDGYTLVDLEDLEDSGPLDEQKEYKTYPKTHLTQTYGSALEVYRDLAYANEQIAKIPGGSAILPPPPLLIASCPRGQTDDGSLHYRTALPQLLNRYFTLDQIEAQNSIDSRGAALFLPRVPLFRGCRKDGFPFYVEPNEFDCIAVPSHSIEDLTAGCVKALTCALEMQAFHKKPISLGEEAQYQQLVIPINNVADAKTWFDLLVDPQGEFYRKFRAVHFTFSEITMMEAFQMQLQKLSLPQLPRPPSAYERAQAATTLTREQRAALEAAGQTALDVGALAGRTGVDLLTTAGRAAYRLGGAVFQ
jgi:hypothetical protein